MNSQLIIQAVIVAASVILGMMLYPRLVKAYTRLVTRLYRNLDKDGDKQAPGNADKKTLRGVADIPPVIGESKTIAGHGRTKATTSPANEKGIEKENIFAPEMNGTPEMEDIDVPLEKVETLPEEEFDAEEENEELETGNGTVLASGVSYDELMETGRVIARERPSDEEKGMAGRILYENRSTEMVEEVVSHDEKSLAKVNELISFHMKKHNLNVDGGTAKFPVPDGFEDFDINSIF
jgi:hypothetical protein